jgi:DNA helicase-2/ATP-dependent DNA helicase PcrA
MNLDQKRLDILASSGHLLIEGGPGCGKTTIALRVARDQLAELGAEQRILFLSFSRAAVRQITDRMRGVFDHSTRTRLEVRTFHAFFLDLVRSHSPELTGKPARFITPEAETRLKFDHDGDWDTHTYDLARGGQYVFDRLADTAATLLEASAQLRALYSDAYPTVIVDEFQDTNVDQWRAVRALAEGSRLICLADPDQRIFEGFVKGVDEHRIEQLREALHPTEFDLSGDNHRSPASGILDYANAILLADPNSPLPPSIQLVAYRNAARMNPVAHAVISSLANQLNESLGRTASIAVLATDNVTLTHLSEQLATTSTLSSGSSFGPVDHLFHFEADKAAAAGYIVASILEWPKLSREQAITQTVEAMIDYYRTVGGTTSRTKASVLTRGLDALQNGGTLRSKDVQRIINAYDSGLTFVGDPVTDWQIARKVLTGSGELNTMFQRVRHLRLLKATDDLAWGLLDTWDGELGYLGATTEVRRILAERILDDSRVAPADVNLMNMHKSKGKEFDGVVVLEGVYQGQLFSRDEHYPARSGRRRLIRVGFTRARHRVVLVRPSGSRSLMVTTPPPV